MNLRLLYGTWNFGAGTLTAGQFYSPLNFFISHQVFGGDRSLFNIGGLFSGRNQGLMLGLMGGALKIAMITPKTKGIAGLADDIDTTFPRLEVKYHLALGKAFFDFAGGYCTYDIETAVDDVSIDAYAVGIAGGVDLGKFYIKGNAWFGQNVGTYGLWHTTSDDPIAVIAPGNIDIVDNDSYGLILVVGARINEMIAIESGIGYTESELDASGIQEDDQLAYYVQATITLAPGVFIVPEVGVIDMAENMAGNNEQKTLYYGLKWQINF